ncbi:MAG: OsmC family protein [Gaiellaceae bacterium]
MRVKEFNFPVAVEWLGDTRVATRISGKKEVETSSPPEFRGKDATIWSPEDFFVGAAASCLAVTLAGIAERRDLPLHGLEVNGDGIVGRRDDGAFGFTRLNLQVSIATDAGQEELAREVAQKAKEGCLVTVSLDLPIEMEVEVTTTPARDPS